MNDAFPMDHDLDLGFRNIEEPSGFNDLEPFVHQGGGIDRDFGAHLPVWMLQCAFGCDVLQLVPPKGPEGASRRRQDQTADILFAMAFQRLEDRAVFAVDWKNPDAIPPRFVLYQFSRHDHR